MKEIWIDSSLVVKECESYNYTPSFLAKTTFFYVQAAGHFLCNKEYYTRREGYKSFLLIYTVNGKGRAKFRDKQYDLCEGQILLIDCYDYQEYYTDSNDLWEIKWVHFYGSNSEEYFNLIYENYGPVIDVEENNKIVEYIDLILNMMKQGDIQFEVKVSNIIVSMLTNIMLIASSKSGNCNQKEKNEQVNQVIEFVEMNYNMDISVRDMAKKACCSIYHFSRVFKKATGYSPYEYLIKYRINRAKTLLKTTDNTIDEIAHAIGFDSTSNFINTFRKLEDVTPLKYRRFWTG